jgi:hypothetical protein
MEPALLGEAIVREKVQQNQGTEIVIQKPKFQDQPFRPVRRLVVVGGGNFPCYAAITCVSFGQPLVGRRLSRSNLEEQIPTVANENRQFCIQNDAVFRGPGLNGSRRQAQAEPRNPEDGSIQDMELPAPYQVGVAA